MSIKEIIKWRFERFLQKRFPFYWNKALYRKQFSSKADFKNPKDLNEKIQWLMFFTDIHQWTILADKYAVREYVKEKVGEKYLVPLLGVWENIEDINFDMLPDKFVLKPNNGSYDSIICTDKKTIDFVYIKKRLSHSLKYRFGYETAESHYTKIKPKIIAEELLESVSEYGLVDYKIWCFNGVPYCFFVCLNRDNEKHRVDYLGYDLTWTRHPEWFTEKFKSNISCPKPENLEEMLGIASILSEGLPQVRIDLYNINGRIYFGEMTLSSNFGMMPYYTKEFLEEMGRQCTLPKRKFKERLGTFVKRNLPQFNRFSVFYACTVAFCHNSAL